MNSVTSDRPVRNRHAALSRIRPDSLTPRAIHDFDFHCSPYGTRDGPFWTRPAFCSCQSEATQR